MSCRWRLLEQAVLGQFRECPIAGDGGCPESDQSVEKDSGDGDSMEGVNKLLIAAASADLSIPRAS